MPVERKDPSRFHMIGGTPEDNAAFAERDFQIRSGMCPNGCGLMTWDGTLQQCPKCNFVCNTRPELEAQ
jgi:hypothetical protein